MRKLQRRDSARGWIESGAKVTIKTYVKRYGVDRYTAYEDLTALGFPLPPSAEAWSRRPDPTPRRRTADEQDGFDDDMWINIDGRRMFVVDYTPGGAPIGVFEDEFDLEAENSEQGQQDSAFWAPDPPWRWHGRLAHRRRRGR